MEEDQNPNSKVIQGSLSAAPETPGLIIKIPHQDEFWQSLEGLSRIVIGRATFVDLRLVEPEVSDIHAVIETNSEGRLAIYDMASVKGTFVNGERTVQKVLQYGDVIRLGTQIELIYQMHGPVVSEQSDRETFTSLTNPFSKFPAASPGDKYLVWDDNDPERPLREIFNYPPPAQKALRVVMYWGETPLEIGHFVGRKRVSVGEDQNKNDFMVPLSSAGKMDSMMKYSNGVYQLVRLSGMKGVVRLRDRLMNINDAPWVNDPKTGQSILEMEDGDMAKIRLGSVAFFVDFVPAPPHLKRTPFYVGDPLFLKSLVSSVLLTVLLLLGIGMTPPKKVQSISAESIPERVVITMQNKPRTAPPKPKRKPPPKQAAKKEPPPPKEVAKPEPKPKPKPKPQPPKKVVKKQVKKGAPDGKKTAQSPVRQRKGSVKPGKEGEGARARGESGTRGRPDAPKANVNMNKARRTGKGRPGNVPTGGAARGDAPGTGAAEAMVSEIGGLLSQTIAGGRKNIEGASKNLNRGYGDRDTRGSGGLADVGTGSGGGGKSYGIGGLGTKGLGGGRKGDGTGAYGTGGSGTGGVESFVGGRRNIEVSLGAAEDVVILGSLDPEVINRVLARHMGQIRYCYEEWIQGQKRVRSGVVPVNWVIAPSGRVSRAGIEPNGLTLKAKPVLQCLLRVFKKMRFPEPQGGGSVEVTKRFTFRPSL